MRKTTFGKCLPFSAIHQLFFSGRSPLQLYGFNILCARILPKFISIYSPSCNLLSKSGTLSVRGNVFGIQITPALQLIVPQKLVPASPLLFQLCHVKLRDLTNSESFLLVIAALGFVYILELNKTVKNKIVIASCYASSC